MSVVPAGTLDMIEENIINEEPAQNVDVDELERFILDFYAHNNDILDEENDDDDGDE